MQKKDARKTEEINSRVTTSRDVRAQVNLDIYVDFVDFYCSLFDIQHDASSCRDVGRDVKTRNAGFRIQLADRRR